MTTALAVQESPGNGVATHTPQQSYEMTGAEDPTGGRLVMWAKAAHAASQLARALVNTSFVPDQFKSIKYDDGTVSPDDATAVILMGDEVGLSPLASLRSIFIFRGTPGMYARTMRALVQSKGHRIWTKESGPDRVVVCGQRRGEAHVETSEWTGARARLAGYATKNEKYRTKPQAMLQARADADVRRLVAADVLAGIPYSIEELEMEADIDAAAPAAAAPRTTQRRTVKAIQPTEPPVDGDRPVDVATAVVAGESDRQRENVPDRPVPPRRTPVVAPEPAAPIVPAEPTVVPAGAADDDGADEVSPDDDVIDVAQDPAPPLEPEVPVPAPDQTHGRKISQAQMRRLQQLFTQKGVKDRDEKLAYCGWVVQDEVTSSTELTVGQASAIIDALNEDRMPPDHSAAPTPAPDDDDDDQRRLL